MTTTEHQTSTAAHDVAGSVFTTHADAYAKHSIDNPVNNNYDRPTILRLVGDLNGKRVLELGCAAGGLTAQLLDRGATVTAVDREPQMIDMARHKLGDRAHFSVVDLDSPPLRVVDPGTVDVVVASLVLHYIEDWTPLLDNLARSLKPGGILVASLHHPITGWLLSDRTDYHRTELVSETWDWEGLAVTAHSYRRPISTIFAELRAAGFYVDVVEEPQIPASPDIDPELLRQLNTQPFFLYIRAVKGQ